MYRFLTALALVSPAISLAAEAPEAAPPAKSPIPEISLLPDGSKLKGVMLPRYNEKYQLVGVLKAEAVTLVNSGEVEGTTVSMEFYNPDQTLRGRADLKRATFFQQKGVLTSNDEVELRTERMNASGAGIYYILSTGKGFMRGPATTTLKQNPTETAMNTPLNPLRMTAALGMSLLGPSVLAAAPPPVSAAEKATIEQGAASRAAGAVAARAGTHESLKTDLTDGLNATNAALAFLAQAQIPSPDVDAIRAPDAPLDLAAGKTDTVIHSEGGFYFDAEEGVLVYLKNVTVTDPRFDMSGANELKIFFSRKPPKPDARPNDTPPSDKAEKDQLASITANFDGVERIVATGAIKLIQKPTDGKAPIQASGAVFTYNLKTDQVLITGGYPWVIQEPQKMRATEPHAILKISVKASTFSTEGHWDTLLNLEGMKKK